MDIGALGTPILEVPDEPPGSVSGSKWGSMDMALLLERIITRGLFFTTNSKNICTDYEK